MDPVLVAIFFLLALICFVLAAFLETIRSVHVGWLGLALWIFPLLVEAFQKS